MKILIVDDEPMKIELLQSFIKINCDKSITFAREHNFQMAMTRCNQFFDIVVCDHNLKSSKTGAEFLNIYQANWKDSLCFLYSCESTYVNNNVAKDFPCYSFDGIKTELLIAICNFNENQPIPEGFKMPPTMATNNGVSAFNKELCEALHEQNEKEHVRIEKKSDDRIDQISNSFDKAVAKVEHAIEKTMDGNKKIFFVTLGVFATMVASLALALIKG